MSLDPLKDVFDPRQRSLVRGTALVLASLFGAVAFSGLSLRWTPWYALSVLIATVGTADTARCMRRRWDWYHAGVILLLYADLMIVVLLVAMLAFPLLLQ